MTNRPLHRIKSRKQFRALCYSFFQAPPCNANDVRQGDAHKGFGGGERHGSRHVAHGVMLNTVDGHSGVCMGCFTAGGDAAALIDGHINDC